MGGSGRWGREYMSASSDLGLHFSSGGVGGRSLVPRKVLPASLSDLTSVVTPLVWGRGGLESCVEVRHLVAARRRRGGLLGFRLICRIMQGSLLVPGAAFGEMMWEK